MSDKQLHEAVGTVGAQLLNCLRTTLQESFARHGNDMNNRQFRRPITFHRTRPRMAGLAVQRRTDTGQVQPLADEADKRYEEPPRRALAALIPDTADSADRADIGW
jgi:hypothetical protein